MSNPNIIAGVTNLLRRLLFENGLQALGLAEQDITAQPPDLARGQGQNANRVNLFLYHLAPNGAWRNGALPNRARPGESAFAPLALTLHYLLTAYGADDAQPGPVSSLLAGQQFLGAAMRVLHDHPVIHARDIAAIPHFPEVGEQVENIRITAAPLSVDEMSKLWTTFQTQYRTSVAYEVSVALIDSQRPVRAPMPVLRQGPDDRGVTTLLGGWPNLEEARAPWSGTFNAPEPLRADDLRRERSAPAAQVGHQLALVGQNLKGEAVRVTARHARLPLELELPIKRQSADVIIVDLPGTAAALAQWAAGFYLATAHVRHGTEPERASNAVSFALAPAITLATLQQPPGDIDLTLTAAPTVPQAGQRVMLLFRDGEIAPTDPAQLKFKLKAVPAGDYVVRLRVDGVDSLPIDRQASPPAFDAEQILKVA